MYALSVYLENIEFVCTVPLYLMSHFSSIDPTLQHNEQDPSQCLPYISKHCISGNTGKVFWRRPPKKFVPLLLFGRTAAHNCLGVASVR